MTEQKTRVIVIGGGYAGVLAANHLRLNENVDITLVNPRPKFVERIRLHQMVTGTDDAVVDYPEILGEGIQLVVDSVTRIDAPQRRIELSGGGELAYDYLIYAIGSHGATPVVPGAAEYAYPIS
jgi:NADH dehydrogenase